MGGYLLLLRTRRVIGFAGVGGFFYGGIYAYLSGTPFAYINYYHLPAQWYGVVFGCGILGIMVCNLVNVRLVVRQGAGGLIKVGAAGAAVAGVVVAIERAPVSADCRGSSRRSSSMSGLPASSSPIRSPARWKAIPTAPEPCRRWSEPSIMARAS